jgi:hypothetical protein
LPGPHGLASSVKRNWHHVYLLEPGKPQRELTFLRDEDANPYECTAVGDSPLWAMGCSDSTGRSAGPQIVELLVFDDTRILRRYRLPIDHQWYSSGRSEHSYLGYRLWKFNDGNRRVIYRAAEGYEAYDVLTGKVARWKEPGA